MADSFLMGTTVYLDPRVQALSVSAEVLLYRGRSLCHSTEQWVITPALLPALIRNPTRRRLQSVPAELVDGGLWLPVPGGWFDPGVRRVRMWIPAAIREEVYRRDGYRCVVCGTSEKLSLDHLWPWSLGGSDAAWNLQTMCLPHNIGKGATCSTPS